MKEVALDGLENIEYVLTDDEYTAERSILRGGPEPSVARDEYIERLKEIDTSYDTAIDPVTGLECEVGGVNLDHLGGEVVLFPSTDFSSLTHNIGNAIELAGMGAANPNTPYIYVAYPGNGKSESLSGEDRKHYGDTGRFTTGGIDTDEDPEALPHLEAMMRAVSSHFGVDPSHVSANDSGGRLGMGLIAAARPGTIKDAYLNGVPGISKSMTYSQFSLLREDVESRKQRRGGSEYTPGKVTKSTKQEAKPLMPNIYRGLGHVGLVASTYGRAVVPGNFMLNRTALHNYNDLDDLPTNALFQDTMAALSRQEALITFQANFEEPKQGVEDCIKFGRLVMEHIPAQLRSKKRGVEFIIGTGKLDAHTDSPSTRYAAERLGLQGIATFMRLVFSGKPDSMMVDTESAPLLRAA